MGFFTRLIAGLVAASTLGAGLAGTAGAVDTTGATGDAKGVVKLASDDTSGLPDHLVNGDFSVNYKDQWLTGGWNWTSITPDGKYLNSVRNWNDSATIWKTVNGWDKTKFGWSSTQKDDTDNIQHKAGAVEIQYDSQADNVYAELCAYEKGTAIYQDIKTVPGTLYKIRLKHASLYSGYLDKMQVMVGAPGHEQAVEMTRTSVNGNGDTLNEKSTTIATKVSNTGELDRNHENQWETYEGTYVIPDGQTTTRFTFRSVAAESMDRGNLLDDIVFDKAYRLNYDKNASDASGQVPSNERGRENTVQPAKAKTTGSVKTVADDDSSKSLTVNPGFDVPDYSKLDDGGLHWMYVSPAEGKAWSYYDYINPAQPKHQVAGLSQATFGWQELTGGDYKTTLFELHREKDGNVCADVHGSRTIGQTIDTQAGVAYTVSIRHSGRSKGNAGSVQVLVGPDKNHLRPLEMSRMNVSRTGAKYGDRTGKVGTVITTHSDSVDSTEGNHPAWDHSDDWETYSGTYVATGGKTVFAYRGVDKNGNAVSGTDSAADSVIDDLSFKLAYPLVYDKNAGDATGGVPSSQYGRENTVKPAKAKTNGTVKTVVDTSDGLPTELVNGDFEYPGADVLSQNLRDKKRNWWGVSRKDKMVYESDNPTKWVSLPSTFDSDRFAWDSTEAGKTSGVQEGSSQWHTNEVELQRDSRTGNMYAELSPYQAQSSIRQYIRTTPGALYKVRLKHASLSSEYLDKMQVLIGADGNEQPVRMTRVESQNGLDATGKATASTTISTHASNKAEISWGSGLGYHSSRNHDGQWATYEGVYVATSDVTVFTFKSVDSPSFNTGNLLDDVVFTKAYKLTYDKNSADASGQVPSNQRGKENTTQPAKTKTSGTVKTVADTNASLPDHLVNGDFSVNYHDQWKDSFGGWTSIDPNAGKTLHATSLPNGSSWKWTAINGWDKSKFGWTSTQKAGSNVQQKANAVELQYDDSTADNVYAELCAYEAGTAIYQDIRTVPGTLYKVRLKHASLNSTYLDKMQVMIGTPGHEQPVEMTRTSVNGHGDKLNEKSTTIATKVTNGNNRHHADQWETYEGTYLIPDGQATTRFTFKSIDAKQLDYGNVLDDIVFDKAYKLTYNKNATDASGSVPSDETAGATKQAKAGTTGALRLASDDDVAAYAASNLPKQLVNSDFDHDWQNIVSQSKMTDKYNFANVDPAHGDVEISGALNGKGEASKHWVHLNGFDTAKFGWKSNQTDTRVDGRGGIVEIQRSKANDNMYAEITASQANTYLYQDIDTAHDSPTVYTVKLRYAHRNGTVDSNEKIQILVGAPGHEQPVEMTRIASDRGNKVGEKSTTVNGPNTDGWLGSWDTFQGSVEIPAGQPVSRFTFKALGSVDGVTGNLIDDVQFKLAYPLSYDKNAQDATGGVPSSQYGKENTVKPAKAKTTGSVRLAADKTASGLTVHDLEMNDVPADYRQFILSTTDTRLSQVEFEDGAWYKSTDPSSQGMWPLRIGASLTIPSVGDWTDPSGKTHQISMTMRLKDWNGGSVSELYRFDGHGNIVGDGRFWINTAYGSGYSSLPAKVKAAMGGVDTSKRVGCSWTVEFTYADTGEKVPDTFKGVTGFNDLDGWDAQSDLKFEGVQLLSGFDGAYKRSDAELGTYGTNGFAGIGHDAGDEAHLNAPQQSRHRLAATWTGSTFTFSYDLSNPAGRTDGSRMTFGAPVTRTAVLTYDKNAADASGQVPSNMTPDTTQTASSKSTGKVSDLVQRTTTHEDGSVTVRTVDTSTDVVSGCQVYYPAGQRITLATLAKDGDCWDSSMLTRPGHTQLGWNQDSQATQAQAEVTMVEGGMTVYAVWVGNPVLTYDTNKPNTWNGQMPSTPASVSVAYNTAAADGSGWQSGDTSKIRGYRFLGWYAGPQDDAGLYDWNTLLTGNVTVYAHWQRLQANVVYDANGGTGSHVNTPGWQYTDATVPSDTSKSFKRDGYVFLGWDTQADGNGTAYKDGSQVPLQDKDITLYAQWQPVFEQFTPTGGVSLPLLVAGGVTLLVMGIGSTVMLTRRMRGEQ
ncbi:InlB B-repeat-containing protein [Bifidobacterium pseudocatenulatum]|uniref:InlB B-repeat-containing protein n=1 Tax=Bifidobacterium pseudocatenulatum TaxID=28026 RepID=UPI00080B7A14|nr:InlB B-repeat-containing protein [Bifidobacterium pseudocatenulatum]MCB4882119.1 InlB B-repeat-containing protein [Bifidobacterium pseudocatenulatum]